MEDTIRAVKVSANAVLLGRIAREAAMLPDTSEILELVSGHLVIGRIGRLTAFVVHCVAANRSSATAKNSLRIFLLGPPQHLVQPMHAPITEGAVAVIEE